MAWKTTLLAAVLPSLSRAAQLFVSHYSGSVYTLALTESGGNYTLAQSSSIVGCGSMPSWVTYDNRTQTLYCSDEVYYGTGDISAFSASSTGALTQAAKASAVYGAVANTLYGGNNGDGWVAIAHYNPSTISTFKLPLTSSSKAQQVFTYKLSQPGTIPSRQDAPHPHHVETDPTGAFIVAPDLGADVLRLYTINQSTGNLSQCNPVVVPGGTGPRHAAFWTPSANSTEGTVLFTANELSNTVDAYSVAYNTTVAGGCPTIALRQTLTSYQGNATAPSGSKVAEVRVVGDFLYAATRNDQKFAPYDSMTSYTIAQNGTIVWQALSSSGGTYPRTFQINAAGTLVAIGDQTSANVVIVERDASTGLLGEQVASLRIGPAGTPGNEDGLSSVVWAE